MSSANAIAINRLRMLREKLKRQPEGRTLYFAGDEVIEFNHVGVPYSLVPDGPSTRIVSDRPGVSTPGVVEERAGYVVYDGTTTVYSRYGVDEKVARDHRKKMKDGARTGKPVAPPPANKLIASADEIVEHATLKVGACGVTVLTGEAEEDAQAKKEAREQWVDFKRAACERVLRHYQDRTNAFHANPRNKGQYAPEMGKVELAAQEWLDEYRLGLKSDLKHVCPTNCGYRSDDPAKVERHIRAAHPMEADAQDGPPVADPDPSPKRGRK